ncbi:membrane protein BRI3 [Lampetra fluviatilis]
MSAPPPYGYSQPPVAPGYAPQAAYPPQYGPQYPPACAQPLSYPSQAGPAYAPGPQPTPAVVIMAGGCPSCRMGVMQDDFTCCGIFLAICFFPLGILCCYALRQKRCASCGHTVG